ncbi:MAG: type II toxin-antitoxin system prevent-host-death family antitoxin [Actinomycetota bacterium]|jgi:prevent-host-death family protein|nr:type II toxin-antitoxin system prevent-host-death family antitoxin [Euzebyaceae bacterium]MDQ3453229.1 type II toxin-antitoxin system prevent-host-death family antitoxin [Actinomycetota bacterium]
MATTIAQRDLRNDSADILRRVEAGEEFIVTRNGTPVAELRPAARRRGVSRQQLTEAFKGVPTVDLQQLRTDLDKSVDPTMRDPWQARG